MRYLTPLGAPADPQVMDWRDALRKLDAARYDRVLRPAVAALRPGQRLLVVQAVFHHPTAPWTRRIKVIARRWHAALGHERRLELVRYLRPVGSVTRSRVSGWLYVRRRRPRPPGQGRASVVTQTIGTPGSHHGHRRHAPAV